MASAGTARFPAPAVSFQIQRSPALAWSLGVLNAAALANIGAWWYWAAPSSSNVLAMVLLAWLLAACLAARACRQLPTGRLAWDTENWLLERCQRERTPEPGPETLGRVADAALDLQFCMLLHFAQAPRSRWVWVARRHNPALWLALRRAVYSPARVMLLPVNADAPGTTPAA